MVFRLVLMLASVLLAQSALAADMTAKQITETLFAADRAHPVDFSGKNLSSLDLAGLDFKEARLSGANLYAADLSKADFSKSDLPPPGQRGLPGQPRLPDR